MKALGQTSRIKGFESFWKKNVGLIYILPWIIGFLIFTLYPFIASFVDSFTDYNGMKAPNFVGFKNYTHMVTIDPEFWISVKATITFVLLSVPLKLGFALLIAILLNMKMKYVNFFRTIYYIPSILGGSVAIAIVCRMMFLKGGLINLLLSYFKIPPIGWLSVPFLSVFTISLLTVWQFGSSMIIFLAGLKQIPKEQYEAATVDGASKIKMFFSITVPMLTPVILFNLIMQMINAFQEFTSAFIITAGGPMKATYLYAYKLYTEAFGNFRMGYASALSWMMFAVVFIITALIFKFSDKLIYYEDGGNSK